VKPATLAHAYYNLGMTQFLLDDYDAALDALSKAIRLDGGSIITDGMATVRRARTLAQQVEAQERLASAAAGNTPAPRAQGTATSGGKGTPEERLQKLNELHQKGVVTDDEYTAKRAEILKEM
jgi:tetratricopeptide (TPR) repeat protein